MLEDNIVEIFQAQPGKKLLIITIGNELRGDDGVGPYIAENCAPLREDITLINAWDKPENCIDEAIEVNPDRTLIIDAADFGGEIGEVRLIPEDIIPQSTLSTHTFPIPIISRMIAEDTSSRVDFIGIQPYNIAFGEKMDQRVLDSAEEIILLIRKR